VQTVSPGSDMRPERSGFTLVEMLIVIAVITVLLSMLIPALRGVKESARRVQCLSNLKQFGYVINMYACDNVGQLMTTVLLGGTGMRYPHTPLRYPDGSGQFNATSLAAYVPGIDDVGPGKCHRLWLCPSYSSAKYRNNENLSPWDTNWNPDYLLSLYSYYARVDLWASNASHRQDLTERRLAPGRLLMSDTLSSTGHPTAGTTITV